MQYAQIEEKLRGIPKENQATVCGPLFVWLLTDSQFGLTKHLEHRNKQLAVEVAGFYQQVLDRHVVEDTEWASRKHEALQLAKSGNITVRAAGMAIYYATISASVACLSCCCDVIRINGGENRADAVENFLRAFERQMPELQTA